MLISSFDPVRREIARIALEALLRDGRIQPASIEEAVITAEEDMDASILQFGETALRRLRLNTMHPEMVGLLGKLHYRLSNNQNTLEHSIEVANICALLASEVGLDPAIAKRAGLLHDLGKAVDEDYASSHAIAGADIARRCGEDKRVVNAIAAHHKEVAAESVYAGLVMVGDALSAVRPGVRTSSIDSFIGRVRSIEAIAQTEQGVSEAFAIQSGREVRVIVDPTSPMKKPNKLHAGFVGVLKANSTTPGVLKPQLYGNKGLRRPHSKASEKALSEQNRASIFKRLRKIYK